MAEPPASAIATRATIGPLARASGKLIALSEPLRCETFGSRRTATVRRIASPQVEQPLTSLLTAHRLLAGSPLDDGPERLDAHVARLGELPREDAPRYLVAALEASGLLGRGGAGFPVGRKWRSMAERGGGPAVVVANGAEGEPASFKDRVLMAGRPHLVVDGAILAAEAVGADEIVFYIGEEHQAAVAAMSLAIDERRREIGHPARVVRAPIGYVAGEATAAVHYINSGDARPTTAPPRVSERGVGGRPTLVQNVESLAYAALIARFGDRWYRSAGRLGTRGTALVTVSGAARDRGVREIELGPPSGRSPPSAAWRRPGPGRSCSAATSGRGPRPTTSGISRWIPP